MNVEVNEELLSRGLEQGIGKIDLLLKSIKPTHRLRMELCGMVSTAIQSYLRQQGVDSSLFITNPKFYFDPDKQHVVPCIELDGGDKLVIDATFSQFLGYVGLSRGYEYYSRTKAFPKEKVLSFKLSERDRAVDWLTDVAADFQRKNTHPKGMYGIDVGQGPLAEASRGTIHETYSRIWEPDSFEIFEPSKLTCGHGTLIKQFIGHNAILLTSGK